MFWLVFWILVCVAILAYGIRRMANHDYRFGSGLFKSSDSNLVEIDNIKVVYKHIRKDGTKESFGFHKTKVSKDS